MARPGSSSKFVSVNLNRSYGQPPPSLSTSSAAAGSAPGSSPFSSAPGLYRSRSSNSHGGMVLLSRPSRPQPSSSASLSSSSFKGSKLAVPRPVNLPSLRREHAGNDPTVALVGGSGSSGWSKQQVSALPVDDVAGQAGVSLADSSGGEVRSAALPAESSWGAPASLGRGVAVLDGVNRNEVGRLPIAPTSSGRPTVYTPPGARSARTSGSPDLLPLAVEKAVVLRGEDFPSLQAAVPSPSIPHQQRQKDLQQKQREKQYELKEQQKKLHQLSQQQHHAQKTGVDASLAQHPSGPQLQPAHHMRPPVKSIPSSSPSKDDVRSLDHHHTFQEHSHGRSGRASQGPSPLIRWNHTSNWADDERETLQTFPLGMVQSNRVEQVRPRNGYRLADDLAFDHSADVGFGRPLSRNGSLLGSGRDRDEFQDKFPAKNGGLGFEGGYSKDLDFSNGFIKDIQSDRLVLEHRDDIGKWDRGFGRNDSFKGGWGSAVKDSNLNRDVRLGNLRRPASFGRDNLVNRDNGFEREVSGRGFRDTGDGRDSAYRGDALGREAVSRDAYSRDERLGLDSGFGIDVFLNKRGAASVNVDRGRGWQGDSTGRSNGNGNGNAYRFDGPAGSSYTSAHVSVRGRRELNGSDYGRDKRPKVSNGQVYVEDPFLGDILDHRMNSIFGLEAIGSAFGFEVKALKKKKEGPKDTDFRDLARESFEAELERVQKIQEQERQRIIEEREKAVELARKEQEERERRSREEEELRLRLEEEAKEAAARAQRVAEEAARKVEEERQAREEEKKRMLGEEERRKEAARRKLLELEERIAKRTREEVLQKEGRAFPMRPLNDEEATRFQDLRRSKEMNWEDQERLLPRFSKTEQDDELADRPVVSREGREFVERPSSQGRLLDSTLQSTDMKVERNKTEKMWRRESFDNGTALPVAVMKSTSREDLFLHRQSEQESRSLTFRELKHGARRNALSVYSQERGQSDFSVRSSRASAVQEQRWTSSDETGGSVRYFGGDVDAGYGEVTNESDPDRWWGRENRRRFREGQQLPSSYYLHGDESTDYPSFGRLRQSLPKQPRVPPPLPGRATLNRQNFKLEDVHSVRSNLTDDESVSTTKPSELFNLQADPEAHEAKAVNAVEKLLINEEHLKQKGSALEEFSAKPDINVQESDELIKDVLTYKSQTRDENLLEEGVSETPSSDIDNGMSSPFESAEKPGDFVMEIAIDLQAAKEQEPEDSDDGCVVQAQESVLVEEVGSGDSVQAQHEVVYEELKDQEILKVIKVEPDNEVHSTEYLSAEYEAVNVEDESNEDAQKEGLVEEHGQPINCPLQEVIETIQEVGQEAEAHLEDLVSQKAVPEPADVPVSQMSGSELESVQLRQSEDSSPRQSLLQQLQQPFSFMAVPLPQSNPPNSVAPHQPMLAAMHGLQNQQEVPFHLQLGLLSGTPFMPNAIQIGSIQMPLHLHPQMPQLAHLQSQQSPFFQFGQIGHPAPLNPSLPLMQPAVQMHHEMMQPLVPQHNQLQTVSCGGASVSYPNPVVLSQGGDDLQQTPSPRWIDHIASLDGSGHNEHRHSRSQLGSECSFEQVDPVSLVDQQEVISDGPVSPSMDQSSALALPVVSKGHETVSEEVGSSMDAIVMEKTKAQYHSAAWPSGGRRKMNAARTYGVLGRGRGRFYGRKNGFEAPRSAVDVEKRVDGGIRSRTVFRNFRGGEYKVRDAVPVLDRKSSVVGNQAKRQYSREMSQASGCGISIGIGNKESRSNKDSLKELGIGSHSWARDGEVGQNVGASLSSLVLQSGAKVERLNSSKVPKKNGLTSISLSEGILKKYKADSTGDAPLHSGVVCVFEQPGIETPDDEDDFIQVRSKRQMLREQREQREKENKAKSKEFKAKEQTIRKQQRLSTKHSEGAATISSKGAMERRSVPSAVTANDETRLVQNLSVGFVTSLSQSTTTTSAQVLPSISSVASVVPDGVLEKTSKPSNSGQASSTSGSVHNESVKLAGFAHDHHCSTQDGVTNTATAWGGQGAAHKVVSLTQIQLEEAMKPIRFEGSLPQKVPTPERASMVLEPGIPVTSMIAHEKAPAPVSVPGPISSLLAGEKIQFGAVTAPTFISSSTHPLSPALLAGVGSSLETRPDIPHGTNHPNSLGRHLVVSSGDTAVDSSQGNRVREGDDIHGQVVDSEAEAEAAASAVAVAAISSDDLMGNVHHSNGRNAVLGVPTLRPVIMQTAVKTPVSEDSMAAALPADLSVETPSPLLQGSLSGGQVSSGFMLQSLPGVPSPFPCLEMGNMLGGPIFTFGPGEDISSLSQASRPGVSLEQGHSVLGTGGITGWQPRHSGAADSFYGAPPGLSGPFVSPAGRIPSIQGPPHMLVYTNPFAQVGQFGQLGVSFMGTYLPSGKQPDWKHTPMTSSSSGPLNLKEGDTNGRLPSMIASQGSTVASNSAQRMSPGESSIMSAAAPLSLFDANLSAPFQISNTDVPVQPHWSKVPPPIHNVPMASQAVGLNLQPRHSSALPSQLGHLPHLIDVSSGFHQLPASKPLATNSFTSVDAAAQFPDELGLGDSDTSFLGGDQRSATRSYVSNSSVAGATGSSGIKTQRGRRPPRNARGGNNVAACSNSGNLVSMSSQGSNGSRSGTSHLQTENNGKPGTASHQPQHSLAFPEQRASQQGLVGASLGMEWSGSNHRKGAPGRTNSERGTVGGKGFALSTKLKQVYVAKAGASSRKLGAGTPDTDSTMFSDQEAVRTVVGC